MKLIYVIDYVFMQSPDGRVWTDTSYDADFWQLYLDVYTHVSLVSRVQPVLSPQPGWKQVTSDRISVCPLPPYRGAKQYLRHASILNSALRQIFKAEGATVLRMPSNLARCAAHQLDNMGKAYAVEVVGDPHAALAPGVVEMTGRAILRRVFTWAQRRICRNAIGVSYVAQSLRDHYPEDRGVPALVCSDVRLDQSWLRSSPRSHRPSQILRLLTVATLSQTYKGIDVLLDAMSICKANGCQLSLTIVGTGRYRGQLEQQARGLGLSDSVHFAGAVPWGPELIYCFDAHDMFVLPSRVEVMPRALLEALARGLPAIATNVGAINEVVDAKDIVLPGDAWQLADRISACATRPESLTAMSARNLARAQEFSSENLLPRWRFFHWQLRLRFQGSNTLEPVAVQSAAA